MDGSNLSLGLAFFAGLASFLSPCVFALVPAYIGYLGGRSIAGAEDDSQSSTLRTLSHGFAFVAGFSAVFILLGLLVASLGSVLADVTTILVRVGGIVVILFGLHMTGIFRIKFLEYDLRPQADPDRRRGYWSSALMGVFFSAGWAPCVGPVLGSILTLALNGGSVAQGGALLTAYSAGLAIPFLLAATQIGWVTFILRRYGKLMFYAERVMGLILIVIGAYLFSGRFSTLGTLGTFFDIFDELAVGRLILYSLVTALTVGLAPGFWARQKGKNFIDFWFIGTGITLAIIILFFALGWIPASLPFLV
jgi:cytochrome c-type biogenesis protein